MGIESARRAEEQRREIIHAFGNALTGIRGYAELLMRRGDDKTQQAAGWIMSGADEVARLAEELADRVADLELRAGDGDDD